MKKLFWGLFLILCFVITLPASWWLLAKADFGYAYLYDYAAIDEHIARFAPKNIYRHDFEHTTKDQRVKLFGEIVQSIQNKGKGLEQLQYLDNKGRDNRLLTDAEITHLKDVAILLEKASLFVGFSVLIWLVIVFFLRARQLSLPSAGQQFLSLLFLFLMITVVLFSIGLENVFNQLHIWAFPKDHQWFFYYEESLMSTMMKAPDLFAYIAFMWFIVSLLLTMLLCRVLRRVLPEERHFDG